MSDLPNKIKVKGDPPTEPPPKPADIGREPRYTFEEILGAMTSQEAIDAAEIVHRDHRTKSKPTFIYLKEMLEAAVEGAFGA